MSSTGESVRRRIMAASSVAGGKQRSDVSIVSPSPFTHTLSQRERAAIKTSVVGEGKAAGSKSQSWRLHTPYANVRSPAVGGGAGTFGRPQGRSTVHP